MNKDIFNSYSSVEIALLNDLATEAKTKGKKARALKGERYYVKFDSVWYDATPEQCRIYKLIRNNYNHFVKQLNSAKSDILGVWKTVWNDSLSDIIVDLGKGVEVCQKYFDAFETYVTKSGEEVEEVVTVEENEDTCLCKTSTEPQNQDAEYFVCESHTKYQDAEKNETAEVSDNGGCGSSVVEYKLIEGFEDYMVSSDGKVWSLKRGKMKELKATPNTYGYLRVALCANGQKAHKLVHRLVAEAFIANSDNLPEVNHKDEDKTNNFVDNLEWCTGEYNLNYGTHNDRSAKARINHPNLSTPVVCLETGVVYPSVNEASRQTGVNRGNITSCLNGKYKSAGGYHWARFVKGDNPVYE